MSNIANVKRRGWSRASEMGSARQSSCFRSLLCICCCCCGGNTVNAACLCPAQSPSLSLSLSESQLSFSYSSDSVRFEHVPFAIAIAIAMCHVCWDCFCARHEFLHRASSFPLPPSPTALSRRFLCVVRFVIKRRTWLLCLVVVQGKQMSGMTTYICTLHKTGRCQLWNTSWETNDNII